MMPVEQQATTGEMPIFLRAYMGIVKLNITYMMPTKQ